VLLHACTALNVPPSQGLQIAGNEPSPLFDHSNPFWDVYQNDSRFVPQPSQYTVVDSQALVLHNWTFNKSAWVLRSQVRVEGHAMATIAHLVGHMLMAMAGSGHTFSEEQRVPSSAPVNTGTKCT
jgi:hypothetical protein